MSGFSGPVINGGSLAIYFPPEGRLTLTSGTPVMATSVAAATTVYYTPYCGDICPIYDGTYMVPTVFAELSQSTGDATKSPAGCAANSNYDLFVWNDAGTIRCTRGPAWTDATTRSAGTALVMVKGIYLNNVSITNGPAAQRGTYVGTIRANATATVDHVFGTIASGGGMATFGIWNAYNRIDIRTMVGDSTDSWTYGVAGTWRAANASSTIRANFVRGLNEDGCVFDYWGMFAPGASVRIGVGLSSTTVPTGSTGLYNGTNIMQQTGKYSGLPGLGFGYVSALEWNSTTTPTTWFGDAGDAPNTQSGLHVALRA